MRQVVIAIQTTGGELSAGHKIIEIGCIELRNHQLTGNHFHCYINPEREVDESVTEEYGITNEFILDKPSFQEIAEEVIDFLSSDEIITYNSNHTLPYLHHEIALSGIKKEWEGFSNNVVDILQMSNERHPHQNNSFSNLCERYYIDTSQTEFIGALYTAEVTADLFLALVDESTKQITSDLSKYEEGENLVIVNTFAELDAAIEGISKSALCRGVSNHEYPLLPSLFRHTDVELADSREDKLMWVFKTHAKPHLQNSPENEVEWLTIAQHHGLPTRLLDWSLSPLVACFFAVQNLSSKNGAIYVYDVGRFAKEEEIDISRLNKITAFFPSHATKRVTAQSGMFTIHPTDNMKLESHSIKKIVIPANQKKHFLDKLLKYGIHFGTVFPDLDGLSNYLSYINDYR